MKNNKKITIKLTKVKVRRGWNINPITKVLNSSDKKKYNRSAVKQNFNKVADLENF